MPADVKCIILLTQPPSPSKWVLLINCHLSKTTIPVSSTPAPLHLCLHANRKLEIKSRKMLFYSMQNHKVIYNKIGICPAAAASSENLSYKFLLWGVLVTSFLIFLKGTRRSVRAILACFLKSFSFSSFI